MTDFSIQFHASDTNSCVDSEKIVKIEMKFFAVLTSIIGIFVVFASAIIEPECDCHCPETPAANTCGKEGIICHCPECPPPCDCSCPPKSVTAQTEVAKPAPECFCPACPPPTNPPECDCLIACPPPQVLCLCAACPEIY